MEMSAENGNDLAAFEKYCRHWAGELGLYDWTYSFEYMAHGEKNNLAEATYNHYSRQVTFRMSRKPDMAESLNWSAYHEVMHILLADLSGMAEEVKNLDVVVREEHRIISRVKHFIMRGGKHEQSTEDSAQHAEGVPVSLERTGSGDLGGLC
jgi:hypothetical protein